MAWQSPRAASGPTSRRIFRTEDLMFQRKFLYAGLITAFVVTAYVPTNAKPG
jgi:hypothetical protein